MGSGCSSEPQAVPISNNTHSVQSVGGELFIANKVERSKSLTLDEELYFGVHMRWSDLRLDEEIGKGNHGVVYKGHINDIRVAVKALDYEPNKKKQVERDFSREIDIISQISHPNIVRFLGAVQEVPRFCFVMEYCEGNVESFLQMISETGVMITWDLLINIALGAARAIAYLHGLDPQVLHRDIKPSNLLLTNDFVVKVTDFGLSRMVDGGSRRMTKCGSMFWIAPEIIRGDAYDSAVDVYSFGISMWGIFNFKKPFEGEDPEQLPYLVAVKKSRPDMGEIPSYLNDLVQQCWADDPTTRPSFEDIVDYIQDASSHMDLGEQVNVPINKRTTVPPPPPITPGKQLSASGQ